jgi:hypothetical protein
VGNSQLPVACTLGPTDGAERLAEWRRIAALAGAGRQLGSGMLVLSFRELPGVGPELERLVTAERECCAFLGWELRRDGDAWQVLVTGPDEALHALSLG